MPPRPTAAATAASSAQAQQDSILETEGIDAYELPKALITRIAKSGLPPTARFSHDTIIALNRGATVFINYLSASAQDVAHSKSHKTVAATDVMKALELLELNDIAQTLQKELEIFRQDQKSGTKGKNKAVAESGASTPAVATTAAPAPAPVSVSKPEATPRASSTPTPTSASGPSASRPPAPPPAAPQPMRAPQMHHPPVVTPFFTNPYAPPPRQPGSSSTTPTTSSNLNPYTVTSGPYRPATLPAPGPRRASSTTTTAASSASAGGGNGVFEDPLPPNTSSGDGR